MRGRAHTHAAANGIARKGKHWMEPEAKHAAHSRSECTIGGIDFVRATLLSVKPCPARSDYVEVTLSTDDGRWNWCFPRPGSHVHERSGPLALTMGRHGVEARLVAGNNLASMLPTSVALATLVAGADIYLSRQVAAKN